MKRKAQSRTSREAQHIDARDALRETGITLKRNLDWVVRFTARSLETEMTRDEYVALCEELYVLVHLQAWGDIEKGTDPAVIHERLKGLSMNRPDRVTSGKFFRAGFETWLRLVFGCHGIARAALTSLMKHGMAHLPNLNYGPIVYLGDKDANKAMEHGALEHLTELDPVRARQAYLRYNRSLFIERLRDMLRYGRNRLSRCESPRCQKVYVIKKKGQQQYCEDRCRYYEGGKRWRKKVGQTEPSKQLKRNRGRGKRVAGSEAAGCLHPTGAA